MALQRPLVIIGGQVQQIPTSDTIDPTLISQSTDFTAINNEATPMVICQVVYADGADTVSLGRADAPSTSDVVGLAKESVAASVSGTFAADGPFEATTGEWDSVTGDVGGLTAGSVYYLDPTTAGNLTTTPPSTVGQSVTRLGVALSTTKLSISIRAPILL